MPDNRSHILYLFSLCLLIWLPAGCMRQQEAPPRVDIPAKVTVMGQPSPGILQQIQKRGSLRVAIRINRRPMAFQEIEDGAYIGFEVDLAHLLARRLGVKVELLPTRFKRILPKVVSGEADCAIACITHRQDRERFVDFSISYFLETERVLVYRQSGVHSLTDLKHKKVAVVSGDSVEEHISSIFSDIMLYVVDGYPDHYEAFESGLVQAVAADYLRLKEYMLTRAAEPEQCYILTDVIAYAPYGIVLPENDSDWRDFVNLALMRAFRDGSFERIFNKWFSRDSGFAIDDYSWKPEIWP